MRLLRNPIEQFELWFAQAAREVPLPEAAALATATAEGAPSARMVLVRRHGEEGFAFYSGYESRKGTELAQNPRAAIVFYWEPLGRQVRIEGRVRRMTLQETAAYVRRRPRQSQISALASPQSAVIESRAELELRVKELQDALGGAEPPLPDTWGGFELFPVALEFWQHRDDRLHDRLRYRREDGGGWLLERLAP